MINLLPPSDRKQLAAARTNNLLYRYVLLLCGILAIMGLEVAGTLLLLGNAQAQSQAVLEENKVKTQKYQAIKLKSDKFRSDLSAAKQILSDQVSYPDMMVQLAQTLPPEVVIDRITLDPVAFGKESTLNISAKSYEDIIRTKTNLEKSTFATDVAFDSLTSLESNKGNNQYPFNATIRLKINNPNVTTNTPKTGVKS